MGLEATGPTADDFQPHTLNLTLCLYGGSGALARLAGLPTDAGDISHAH